MKYVDIVNLTRDIVGELGGFEFDKESGETRKSNLDTLPLADLLDFGRHVNANGTTISTDNFYKALIDRLGRLEIENRKYSVEIPSIYKSIFEWGGFLERVYVNLANIYDDLAFEHTENFTADSNSRWYGKSIADIELGNYDLGITAKVYDEIKAYMIPFTRANDTINSAFKSESEYIQLLNAMLTSIDNTITAIINAHAHATLCTAIAHTATAKSGDTAYTGKNGLGNVVHLLTEYKAIKSDSTITKEEMLTSVEGLAFIMERIKTYSNSFKQIGSYWNNHETPTFTPADKVKTLMLDYVKNKYDAYVKRTSYNEIELPTFDTIGCWQSDFNSNGNAFDFNTISTVKVTKNENKGIYNESVQGETYTRGNFDMSNIIAISYDDKAIGQTVSYNRSASTPVIASTLTVNTFWHIRINNIVDDNYNMCVFVLD